MQPPQKKQFKPQNLRTILSIVFILVLLGGGAAFYWGLGIVRTYSVEVNKSGADAEASGKKINELQTLRNQLVKNTPLIEQADKLFATPATYQSQVLSDLNNYAEASGLSLANTSFGEPVGTSYPITITFKQPVSYSGLITFLHNVEGNLPKLQVSSIALGRPASGSADRVKTGEIKIDISVR